MEARQAADAATAAALAEAGDLRSKCPPGVRTPEEEKKWEREYACARAFEADFDEWLDLTKMISPDDNELSMRFLEREEELALSLLTRQIPHDWMIYKKFQIIEYQLARYSDSTTPNERMAILALAAIKADLMRFESNRPN
jgi:hypothetical protein